MKTIAKLTPAALGVFFIMAFTSLTKPVMLTVTEIKPKPIIIPEVEIELEPVSIEVLDHSAFLDAIGHQESGNNYEIVNTFGYMGRYQFGQSTLKGLGYNLSRDEFLQSPFIQEQAMTKLLNHNRKKLSKYIEKYEGKTVHGIFITESGVLAAAHLAGAGNVRKFFRRGYEFQDGYGTRMTTYMEKFSGYQLDI